MKKNIESCSFRSLAKEFGTPLFVYSKAKILKQISDFRSAFTAAYPQTKIHYAIKANANPHILKLISETGLGADCTSPGELYLAKLGGFSKENIIYTGNYESSADLAAAIAAGVTINLDDETSLDRLLKIAVPKRLSFRINPRFGKGSHAHITTGGENSKFGIPIEKAESAYQKAMDAGVESFGVHVMAGSNNLSADYFKTLTERVLNLIGPVFNRLNIRPHFIDLGGGFGIPYQADEENIDLTTLAQEMTVAFLAGCEKYDLGKPDLYLEPGRFIVGQSGYLLSSVTGTKESYERFIGLDAGMNTLLRPALYNAFHHVFAPESTAELLEQNLCGQICESTDVFARNRLLPKLDEGDLLVFENAGAYGYGLGLAFNGRARAAEVLVDDHSAKLIRRRENIADLLALVPHFDSSTLT